MVIVAKKWKNRSAFSPRPARLVFEGMAPLACTRLAINARAFCAGNHVAAMEAVGVRLQHLTAVVERAQPQLDAMPGEPAPGAAGIGRGHGAGRAGDGWDAGDTGRGPGPPKGSDPAQRAGGGLAPETAPPSRRTAATWM